MAGTVWVGSLSSSYNETKLVTAFSKYGKVTSCVIRGGEYALVRLATARDALRAADATHGVKIDGARVQMYCYEATTTSRVKTGPESNSAYDRCNDVERWERYTDCYYFMQEQRCTRPAGTCAYRHSDKAAASNDVCQKWLQRRCLDVSCLQRHPGKMEQGLLQHGSGGHLQFSPPPPQPRPRGRRCSGGLLVSNRSPSYPSGDNEKGSPHQRVNGTCTTTSPAMNGARGGSGPHRRVDCEVMEEWSRQEVDGDEEFEVGVGGEEVGLEEEVDGEEVELEEEVGGKEVGLEEKVGEEEVELVRGETSILETLGQRDDGAVGRSENSPDPAHLRSYMIECLQSFIVFRAPLGQYLKELLISFNVAILEADIHSMCGDVIDVINLNGGKVVLFHSFNPFATMVLSTSAVASFQVKVVDLLHNVPELPLLDLLFLYYERYGPLPCGQGGEETTPFRLLQGIPNIGWSGEGVTDLVLTITTSPEASPSIVPVSSSTSLTVFPWLQSSPPRDPVLRLADIQKPLTKESYKDKFGKLLLWEENEQRLVLRKRCEGTLNLVISSAGGEGGGAGICNAYLVLDRGVVLFVSQVSERATVMVEQGTKVCGCHGPSLVLEDVVLDATLRLGPHPYSQDRLGPHPYSQDRLGMVFERRGIAKLQHCGFLEEGEWTVPVRAKFFHNCFKFERLNQSLESLSPALISRLLLPEEGDFPNMCLQPLPTEPCLVTCSQDQRDALLPILSLPHKSPPLLVRGALGTGKTFLLAAAIHCLLGKERGGGGARVLVCTPHHTSSQLFMEQVRALGPLSGDVCTLQLVSGSAEGRGKDGVVTALQLRRGLERMVRCPSLLLVTSYLCSSHLAHMLPSEFFSHVLLDGCGQVVEPESTVPLTLVGPSTRVVVTGDHTQVSPLVVLGGEARDNGLAVSLFQRLSTLYHSRGVAGTYEVTLVTSHSSPLQTHNGPSPTPIGCIGHAHGSCVLPSSPSHFFTYPLVFVCSSVDQVISGEREGVLGEETSVVAEVAKRYFEQWPGDWGELDHTKVCIASAWPLKLAALMKENGFNVGKAKHILVSDLQGKATRLLAIDRQFRMLFISTSEPIYVGPDGSINPSNTTKSICNPSVFNTVMTRAQSLVVCVGNPFLLLRLEQSMVKKYGDRGRCWSHYLRACLDHNTVLLHDSLKAPAEWHGDLMSILCRP